MKSASIDIGNSRVKVLSEEYGFAAFEIGEADGSWLEDLLAFIEKHDTSYSWGISSVNPDTETEVIDMLIDRSITIVSAEFLLYNQTLIDVSQVEGAGSDRVFGVIGALKYATPPFITIDCGTAITINYLDSNRVFRGGAIIPGITTQLRALEHFTGKLPLLTATYDTASYGTTTSQAMTIGTLWGAIGAIREIVSRIGKAIGSESIPIIITGGEHLFVTFGLEGIELITCPHLVVEGILAAQKEFFSSANTTERTNEQMDVIQNS